MIEVLMKYVFQSIICKYLPSYLCALFIYLQSEGDLLESELKDIYAAAAPAAGDKIDIEGFVTVYKDIEDLFEDEEESDDALDDDSELQTSFAKLAKDGAITKPQLRQWEDITSLIDDEGMLGVEEFEELWQKSIGGSETMDFKSFVVFNEALDDLFVLEDDEVEEEEANETADKADAPEIQEATLLKPKPVITETDLPPMQFSSLSSLMKIISCQNKTSHLDGARCVRCCQMGI